MSENTSAENTPEIKTIGPQEGPQTVFLNTPADIAVYGGSAGGGKSYALLLEVLRHYNNPKFGGVLFRKHSTQIRNEGGLWDESMALYMQLAGVPRESYLEWTFPSGARIKFAHLDMEQDVYNWQGSQIPYIGWDELTHFSETQFWYMLSRNRSTSGVPGYIRATCNPDADSWVRKLIDWYIGPDGLPLKERSGVLRWFIRVDGTMIWGDSREELTEKYGEDSLPKSFTFIPSNIFDNKILLASDPSYLANLNALSLVDKERLKNGNWNIKAVSGLMFKREWFQVVDAIPSGWIRIMRFWDRAATIPNPSNPDPDWTRGIKLYQYPNNIFLIADLRSARDTPGNIESLIKNTASYDGRGVMIMSQQDPGSAGKTESEYFVRMLAGYVVNVMTTSKDKVTRAKPVSSQAQAGNIRVLRAPWNDELFKELENFPGKSHDDIVDTLSGAFNELTSSVQSILNTL